MNLISHLKPSGLKLALATTLLSTTIILSLLSMAVQHLETPASLPFSFWAFVWMGVVFFLALQTFLVIFFVHLFTTTKTLSLKDDLTGLYNRRHFQKMLDLECKRALRYKRPLSLLMIDADNFKKLNATCGHIVGDRTLKTLSTLLINNLREVDVIARYGGEEFIILLPDTNLKGATFVGEKICELVRTQIKIDAPVPSLTVSIGVSSLLECATSLQELIHLADIALYQAKQKGRNCVMASTVKNFPSLERSHTNPFSTTTAVLN